ncbi:MAG: phosphatidate cytidylyltransferase [Flavobacteriales bacterium]|nr:phosphatidate cytidylyltransferase [Flavobacteriales bacterium]
MPDASTDKKDIKDKFIAASLPVRAVSAVVYVVLLVGCVLWSKNTFSAFMGVCSAVAMIEFARMQRLILPLKTVLFILHAVIILLSEWIFRTDVPKYYLAALTAVAVMLAFVAFIVALFSGRNDSAVQLGSFTTAILYVSVPFSLGMALPDVTEKWVILGIFILLWSNDTFAYIFGISLGRHKLMERISPKKTLEGFVGGVVCTIVAGVALFYIMGNVCTLSMENWIVISLVVSVIGTMGDLVESMFKRQAGVKDSGRIMPGHGGILDRLDSFIMCVPFVFIYLYFIS